jgi:hypothetical protein
LLVLKALGAWMVPCVRDTIAVLNSIAY